jgi:uncharacterized protein YjdB
MKTRFVSMAAACVLLYGCGSGTQTAATSGDLALRVAWPQATRLIPASARSVRVTVTDSGGYAIGLTANRPSGTGTFSTLFFGSLRPGAVALFAKAYTAADAQGVVVAQAAQTAQVAAGATAEVTVELASAVTAVTLSPTRVAVAVDATQAVTASARNADDDTVPLAATGNTWVSGDPAIATVSASGVVRGIAPGTTEITFTEVQSGTQVSVPVTVTAGGG